MSLLEIVGSILTELEKVHQKLDKLLASGSHSDSPERIKEIEAMDRMIEKDSEPKKENTIKTEKGAQDLTEVLLMKESEKAFLVVKHGFQVWVAKSHLQDPDGYDLGNTYDLKVKEKSKWVLKKLEWKPFTVVKG